MRQTAGTAERNGKQEITKRRAHYCQPLCRPPTTWHQIPEIVLAQAILETGTFKSRLCREGNNLFGLRHSKGYYTFNHWEESVIAYRDWVQYKHRDGEGYYTFLKRIGYASAKDYIYKVRKIADRL